MADSVGEEIEDALQLIVSTTEQSTKMKKELKQTTLTTVSTLRDLIVKLHVIVGSKRDEICILVKQVGEMHQQLDEGRQRTDKEHSAPSGTGKLKPVGKSAWSVEPPCDRNGKPL
jgi:hypothetical protein